MWKLLENKNGAVFKVRKASRMLRLNRAINENARKIRTGHLTPSALTALPPAVVAVEDARIGGGGLELLAGAIPLPRPRLLPPLSLGHRQWEHELVLGLL